MYHEIPSIKRKCACISNVYCSTCKLISMIFKDFYNKCLIRAKTVITLYNNNNKN